MDSIYDQTEVLKAKAVGFMEQFFFVGELLFCCLDLEKEYHPKDVVISINPCIANQHTVYRITTPCGIKGVAIVEWSTFENNF